MDDIKMRVSGVEKSFPGVKALSNIEFSVRRGTVHALCGENGAGKSTLMKIIMGLYKADRGQIYIDGAPVEIKNPIQAREYGISMIAQELNYVPELSIEENLFMGRLPVTRYGKVDWKRVRREAEAFLREEGLPYQPSQKLKTLTVSDIHSGDHQGNHEQCTDRDHGRAELVDYGEGSKSAVRKDRGVEEERRLHYLHISQNG